MRPIPSIPPVEPSASRLLVRRRSWLMSAAAVLSAPASTAVQPERSPAPASVIARELLQISPVAGFQFHEGERLWERLAVGDALALVREAANRYDARAVRLDWQGQKIGYIPAVDNAAVSQLLDRGRRLSAYITQLRMSGNPWRRVEVQVFLEGSDG